MWHRVLTFGAEGTEAGNFCRPWGVAIARYSDLSTLSDLWTTTTTATNTTSTTSNELDIIGATSATTPSIDTFIDQWSLQVGNALGFNDGAYPKKLTCPAVGANNNCNITDSAISPGWSTYLIGIADRSNNRIQLFKFDAIRNTVTFLHMFGDGPGARHGQFDRPAGIVFNSKLEQIIVADKDNHRVQVFDMSGSYLFKFGQQGSKCGQFCYPWDIDVCRISHNIAVSDTRNRRIQMFNNLGRYLMHFNQPLDSPRGLTYLSLNQIIVSDFNKHRLLLITHTNPDDTKQVTSSNNSILFNNDSNYLSNSHLNTSNAITNNNNNNLNLNSMNQKSVYRPMHLQQQQFYESKFVGFGEGSSWGEFLRPQGATSYGSTVYCSDSRNNRVACWNKETETFSYISRDVVELDRPAGLAAIDNYIVIVDFGNNRVHICQRFAPMNIILPTTSKLWHRILTFGAEGTEAGNFSRPWGVAIARYSDLSTLSDSWTTSYSDQETTSATSASSSIDTTLNDQWSRAIGVGFSDSTYHKNLTSHVASSNNNSNINNSAISPGWSTYLIGIADRSNNRIQLFKFDAIRNTVTFLHMFGDGPGARHGQFDRPAGIVFNSKLEQIIVADKDNHRVQVFDMSGSYLFKFGEKGSKCGQFCYPWDIDVCRTTHNIAVCDTRNRRIQMFNNLGRYLMHFNQPLDSPRGLTYLSPNQLIVSDFNKHRLLLITQASVDDKQVTSSNNSILFNNDCSYLSNNQHLPQLHGNSNFTNNTLTINNNNTISTLNNNNSLHNLYPHPHHQQQQHLHQHHSNQKPESKFVGFGEGSSWGEFLRPQGATSYGSTVYCSDSRNNRVACWNKETETFSYISRDVVELDRPAGLAAIDNYIVIVDFGNNRIHICQRVLRK